MHFQEGQESFIFPVNVDTQKRKYKTNHKNNKDLIQFIKDFNNFRKN